MLKNRPLGFLLLVAAVWATGLFPAQGASPVFSKPQRLATLPWDDGSNHGVPVKGPEWLLVDAHGRIYLESDLDILVYSPDGKYRQTLNPIDKKANFYGFAAVEALSNGDVAVLTRLESPQEQWGKDDFQEQTKPGARLILLGPDGTAKRDVEVADPRQPHSNYGLDNGAVYSIHDDGTFEWLESFGPGPAKDAAFGDFAAIAYNMERWQDHLRSLPVFRTGNKAYRDTKGKLHEMKGALSFLMGRPFVEGSGPLAMVDGRGYFKVVLDENWNFINAVFVEDFRARRYGLVELVSPDEDLNAFRGHTLFVDEKGDLFEGVARKDGYLIYEWKAGF